MAKAKKKEGTKRLVLYEELRKDQADPEGDVESEESEPEE